MLRAIHRRAPAFVQSATGDCRALAVAAFLVVAAVAGPVSGLAAAARSSPPNTASPERSTGTAAGTASATNATNVSVLAGSATPTTVVGGRTVRQSVTVYVAGVSADGAPDTHLVAFPNALATNLSLTNATVTGNASVTTARLADGFDGDGTTDAVAVKTNATGGGTVPLAVTVTVTVTYPPTAASYAVDARIVDSTGSTATKRDVATVTARAPDTGTDTRRNVTADQPTITDFALNATEQDVDVVVTSTEDLEKMKVKVKSKVKNVTLTRADFTETTTTATGDRPRFVYEQDVNVFLNNTSTGDVGKIKVKVKSKVKKIVFSAGNATRQPQRLYVYRADVSDGKAGTFNATLVRASSGGHQVAVGQTDEVTVAGPSTRSPLVFFAGLTIGAAAAGIAVLAHRHA